MDSWERKVNPTIQTPNRYFTVKEFSFSFMYKTTDAESIVCKGLLYFQKLSLQTEEVIFITTRQLQNWRQTTNYSFLYRKVCTSCDLGKITRCDPTYFYFSFRNNTEVTLCHKKCVNKTSNLGPTRIPLWSRKWP